MNRYDISIGVSAFLFGIALTAAGCRGGDRHDFHDTGRACVFPAGQAPETLFGVDTSPRNYPMDGPLEISVMLTCLSSTCTVAGSASASCTVEQIGQTLIVEATGSFRDTGDEACSTDCRALAARCATPVVSAGTYTLQYAGKTAALVVPSSSAPPCVE